MFERKIVIVLLGYIIGIIMELYFEKGIALFVILIFFLFVLIKYAKLKQNWFFSLKQYHSAKRIIRYCKQFLNLKIKRDRSLSLFNLLLIIQL